MQKKEEILSIQNIPTAVTYRHGQGPTLVFLHGLSLDQETFQSLWDDESLSSFPMLSYDLPGHGKTENSRTPEETYSFSGYAAHLKLLLKELGIQEVFLIGISLGGHLALIAAVAHLYCNVKGIFSVGSPPIDTLDDMPRAFLPHLQGVSTFNEILTDREIAILVDDFTENEKTKPSLIKSMRSTDNRVRKFFMENLIAGDSLSEHDFIKSTTIPLLFTFGSHEKMINVDYLNEERITSLLGDRLKWIPNGAHLPDWAGSCGFKRELYKFVDASIG